MRLSARDALAILYEAGIDCNRVEAAAWMMAAVDGLDPEQIAAAVGIKPETARVYLWRVERRVRQHHEACIVAAVEATQAPDPEDLRAEVLAHALALLDCITNRPAPPDHSPDAGRPPLVSLDDACRIVAALAVRRERVGT
jgi:hypothetical protein